MAFQLSTAYQAWAQRLRFPWMGTKGKAILGGFAAVLGDRTVDWATQANLEHLPEYASSAQSVALTASERQIDANPAETTTALASRITQAVQLWQYAGTQLGILLALNYAGFVGGYLVQQNGQTYTLTLPLPAIVPGWNPQPNLVVSSLSQLTGALTSNVTPPTWQTPGRSIPAGQSWWKFDDNTDYCSRFAILFTAGQYPSLSASDQARLQSAIGKWKPQKSTCVGIYSLTAGQQWQTAPAQKTWGSAGNWGGSTVVTYAGV